MKTEQTPARAELKDQGLFLPGATVYRGTGQREALCPHAGWGPGHAERAWVLLMNTGEGVREHHREELHSTSDNTIQNFIYTFPYTPIPTTTLHILVLVCVKCVLLLHEPVFLNYINAMSNSFHSELFFTHPHVKSIASATNYSIMYAPASYHTTPQCLQLSDTINTHIPLYTCLKIHVCGVNAQEWSCWDIG